MIFCCVLCHTRYKEYKNFCVCGGKHSIIRLPQPILDEQKRIKSASELMHERSKCKPIPGYEWLGSFPSHWSCMLSGAPGNGKTTFALLLASAISEKRKERACLYWSHEEGHSESLKRKLKQNKIASENLLITRATNFKEFLDDIKAFHPIIFIVDSLNDTGLGKKEIKYLKNNIKAIGIYIAQFTKAGKYKGDSSWEHEVDLFLEINQLKANIKKNRFGELKKEIPILEQGEKNEQSNNKREDRKKST